MRRINYYIHIYKLVYIYVLEFICCTLMLPIYFPREAIYFRGLFYRKVKFRYSLDGDILDRSKQGAL